MKPEEVFFLSNGRVAFEHAWIVLKMTMEESRQTELGEYHPDFPSSHGPVKWYHGTTVEPASRIRFEGLHPSQPWYGGTEANNYMGSAEDDWRHPKGVYATSDLDLASDYASWRSMDRNQALRVFGIREGVPETPSTSQTIGGEDIGSTGGIRFDNPIPRQYITPVPLYNTPVPP